MAAIGAANASQANRPLTIALVVQLNGGQQTPLGGMTTVRFSFVQFAFRRAVFRFSGVELAPAVCTDHFRTTLRCTIALWQGGLADVDAGDRTLCGGYARDFFYRVGARYTGMLLFVFLHAIVRS